MGLLDKEVLSIATGGVNKFYEAKVTAIIDTGKFKIYPLMVISLDVHRNYANNISDVTTIVMNLPKGDFIKVIEPNKNNLKVIVTAVNIGYKTKGIYKLILSTSDTMTESKVDTNRTVDEMNKDAIITITGECVNETINQTRLAKTQATFKNTTPAGVINSVLGGMIGNFGSLGGMGNKGLQIVPPDNSRVYEQIVLKEGMTVLDIPSYLQETNYGLYNGGIGTYVQRVEKDETTFIYPLYGNKKDIFDKVLTIIDVTNSMTMDNEFTYGVLNKEVKIIASVFNATKPADEASAKVKGTGIIAVDADAVMNRSAEVSKDKVVIKKENYTREMVNRKLTDGSNAIRSVGVTNNLYKHRSETLMADGNLVTFKWQNSNGDLLLPGMSVTHVFVENNVISKRKGILHGVNKMTDNNSKKETSILLVFIRNEDGNNEQ